MYLHSIAYRPAPACTGVFHPGMQVSLYLGRPNLNVVRIGAIEEGGHQAVHRVPHHGEELACPSLFLQRRPDSERVEGLGGRFYCGPTRGASLCRHEHVGPTTLQKQSTKKHLV